MPWSRTEISTSRPSVVGEHLDRRPGVGVLHRVVEQVVDGRHELAAVAEHGEPPVGLADDEVDAGLLGRGPDALDRLGHHQVDRHRLAPRQLAALDPAQLQQVLDGAADAERLGHDPLGQPVGDGGVVLVQQRLGQQCRARRPASSARG